MRNARSNVCVCVFCETCLRSTQACGCRRRATMGSARFALGVGGFAIVGLLLRQYAPQYASMVCPSIQLRRRSSFDGSGLPQFS